MNTRSDRPLPAQSLQSTSFKSCTLIAAIITLFQPLSRAQTNCVSPPSGPVAWWRAEGNANDSVGTNNGTLAGATFTPGEVGQAFNFNGSGQKVTVPDNDALKLTNSLTIEGWILVRGTGFLLFRGDSRPGLDPYSLTIDPGGVLQLLVTDAADNHAILHTATAVPTGQWIHVGATLDGGSGDMKLYVNSSLVAQTNTPVRPLRDLDPAYGAGVGIGGHSGTYGYFPFNGEIDELSLYSRALSADEIAGIFRAGSAGKCPVGGEGPVITQQPQNQMVNVGATATFTVTATGTAPLVYQWMFNGSNITSATSTSLTLSNAQLVNAGTYSVRVTNTFGSAFSSNAFLVVNHVPVANRQSITLDEDTTAIINLTGSDADGDLLTYMIGSAPTHGSLIGIPPSVIYHPATNYFGPDSFTFKVNDGLVDSAFATVSIAVRPVNDAPVALSQSVSLDEDTTLNITLSATDVEGDALTYIVGTPSHGSLTGITPKLTYHPVTNYFGADSFSFKVNDGQTDSAPALVAITVLPVNDAPFAKIKVSPFAEFPGLSNSVVIAPNCSTNAEVVLDASGSSDVENDPLTYRWLDGTNVLATGVLATNQLGLGSHDITLIVSDGMDTGSQTDTVDVITLGQALGIVIAEVNASTLPQRQQSPLVASLNAAAASFERCNFIAGMNQLRAFQNKVAIQVAPTTQTLADDLLKASQVILDSIDHP